MMSDPELVQLYLALVAIRHEFGEFNRSWLDDVKKQYWANETAISQLRPIVIGIGQQTLRAIERGYR